jgi:hypothetical protein
MYHSKKAEEFEIPRFSVKLFPSEFRGILQNLMQTAAEVRKYGSVRFVVSSDFAKRTQLVP